MSILREAGLLSLLTIAALVVCVLGEVHTEANNSKKTRPWDIGMWGLGLSNPVHSNLPLDDANQSNPVHSNLPLDDANQSTDSNTSGIILSVKQFSNPSPKPKPKYDVWSKAYEKPCNVTRNGTTITYNHGDTYRDRHDCEDCRCVEGTSFCPASNCLFKILGWNTTVLDFWNNQRMCIVYHGPNKTGDVDAHVHGARFSCIHSDSELCECNNGTVTCDKCACFIDTVVNTTGKAEIETERYEHNSHFKCAEDCNTCACEHGVIFCEKFNYRPLTYSEVLMICFCGVCVGCLILLISFKVRSLRVAGLKNNYSSSTISTSYSSSSISSDSCKEKH